MRPGFGPFHISGDNIHEAPRTMVFVSSRRGRRVDLVVVTAVGELGQLVQIAGEPVRLAGKMHETILDRRRLGMEAHDFVAFGLEARHHAGHSADKNAVP